MSKKIEAILEAMLVMKMVGVGVTIDHSKYCHADKQKTHAQIEKAFDAIGEKFSAESVKTDSAGRFRRKYRMRGER